MGVGVGGTGGVLLAGRLWLLAVGCACMCFIVIAGDYVLDVLYYLSKWNMKLKYGNVKCLGVVNPRDAMRRAPPYRHCSLLTAHSCRASPGCRLLAAAAAARPSL